MVENVIDVMIISWQIALMWMPEDSVDDNTTLIQEMDWCFRL